MPTHEDLGSPLFHPAEEMPQGPISTGFEFRAMRVVLGLSLPKLAGRTHLRVHHIASIENRPAPCADVDEQVLHVVLMKSGSRWNADPDRLPAGIGLATEVQDLVQLVDDTGTADLAELDEMPGTRVQAIAGPDHVRLRGRIAEVCMMFPFYIVDFWDVVEDLAARPDVLARGLAERAKCSAAATSHFRPEPMTVRVWLRRPGVGCGPSAEPVGDVGLAQTAVLYQRGRQSNGHLCVVGELPGTTRPLAAHTSSSPT